MKSENIHPTAIVSKNANISGDIKIGPYTIIEDGVAIDSGCEIGPHVYIRSGAIIGKSCKVHMGVVLGDDPQDLSYNKEESRLTIGDRNTFREYVTVHKGTKKDSATIIGSDNYFMAFVHIAHNCNIGSGVTICNNTILGGYVEIEDRAFVSADCLMHQFVRIGTLSIIAGGVRIKRDMPPYMASVNDNIVTGYNIVGLKRAGLDPKARSAIKQAYRLLYRSELNLSHALEEIEKTSPPKEVRHLIEFIRSSKRGICFSRSSANIDKAQNPISDTESA